MPRGKKCCCGGPGPGPDPCFAGPGLCFEATFDASSSTNDPNAVFTGGALTGVSTESSTLTYTDTGAQEYWQGTLDESYDIASTTRGLSVFPAISRSSTWDVRISRQTNASGSITALNIGAGNWYEVVPSTNDNGWIEIARSHYFTLGSYSVSPSVPFDASGCPVLPQGDSGIFSIAIRRVYYRNTFGSYVTDSNPLAWTWPDNGSGIPTIGMDREVLACT